MSDGHTGRTVYGVIRAQSAGEHIATIPVECPVDGLIAEGIGVWPGLLTVTVGCAENPLPVNAVVGTEIVAKV